jgi:1,4-dihydroxy-2-naphthoyl-CoA hydrolase
LPRHQEPNVPDTHDLTARCAALVAFFAGAPLKANLGLTLSFDAEGHAIVELPFAPHICHAMGDVHGGIMATIMDTAGWFTAAARYQTWIATIDMQIQLLERPKQEDLVARGTLLKAGRSLAVSTMEIRSATDRLVATGTASFMVSDRPI